MPMDSVGKSAFARPSSRTKQYNRSHNLSKQDEGGRLCVATLLAMRAPNRMG